MGRLATSEVVILLTLCGPGLADPTPDADPDALPQLWGAGGMQSMMPAITLPAPISSMGGGMVAMGPADVGGGNCGMVDECCGMADKGCCMDQGQQCFTKWEQQCRYANKPVCQTQTKEFCDTHPIRECRFIKKPEYIDVPVNKCTPKMEKKCFKYIGKSCKPTSNPYTATFNWTNDILSDGVMKSVNKCHQVKTCKITETMKQGMRKVPKKECRNVPVTTKDCQSIPVPQAPYQVPYTTYRTEYRQQCYPVPKPVCRMEPCSYQVIQQNICPTCVMPGVPGAGCGDSCGGGMIGSGACGGGGGCGGSVGGGGPYGGGAGGPYGGGNMCGACREQNVQMCTKMTQKCEMTTENVCQQIPIRVPVQSTRTVTPPPRYEMQCTPRTIDQQQCKTIYVDEPYEYPVKQCNPGSEEKCYDYEVPDQTVDRQQESEPVEFPSADCVLEESEKEHCTMLPTQLDCRKTTERRGVLIRQRVCDRVRQARYCNILPFSFCQNNPGQECTMVPREVCQPTCQQNNYCDQCSQFAGSGGFSQCSTQTCPNFYSPAANCPQGGSCY